jgi:hypothetical protein
MKFYLEKNNFHYCTFSPNCEMPNKAVIRHLPPDTPAEDILNSLEPKIPAFEDISCVRPRSNCDRLVLMKRKGGKKGRAIPVRGHGDL